MDFVFPSNPNVGDQVTDPNGTVWEWDGFTWIPQESGGGGGTAPFVFTQATPLTNWVVPHNLNFRYVLPQIVNSAGNTVISDIDYVNVNRVDLIFANPVQGTAVIRR